MFLIQFHLLIYLLKYIDVFTDLHICCVTIEIVGVDLILILAVAQVNIDCVLIQIIKQNKEKGVLLTLYTYVFLIIFAFGVYSMHYCITVLV